MKLRTIFFVLTLILAPISYAETISFKCDFPLSVSPNGIENEINPFKLQFAHDVEANQSYLIDNNDSTEVKTIVNQGGGVSFLEVAQSGNIMVTTITNSGEAVHSRNANVLGELVPSQSYGKCDVR